MAKEFFSFKTVLNTFHSLTNYPNLSFENDCTPIDPSEEIEKKLTMQTRVVLGHPLAVDLHGLLDGEGLEANAARKHVDLRSE